MIVISQGAGMPGAIRETLSLPGTALITVPVDRNAGTMVSTS
jgi:hypothetical protein